MKNQLLLILFLFTVMISVNVNATTRYVTNGNAIGDGSLAQAILQSGEGDTVIVQSSEVDYIDFTNGVIALTSDLTLINPDEGFVELDAMDMNSFFYVSSGHLTMEGFRMTKGAAENGGAIVNYGKLTLRNCEISLCNATDATGKGGAIYSVASNSTVVAENTLFMGNSAFSGGAVYIKDGSQRFTNCSFYQNDAEYSGGAVVIESSIMSIFQNSTFAVNGNISSGILGGAIAVFDGATGLFNCTVVNNMAVTGGAIYCTAANSLVMVNSIVGFDLAGTGTDVSGSISSLTNCIIRNGDGATIGSAVESHVGTTESPVDPMINSVDHVTQTAYICTLKEGSPAINAATAEASATDQLGKYRNGIPDIGAIEFEGCDDAECSASVNMINSGNTGLTGTQVYPNPVSDVLTISNMGTPVNRVQITDLTGRSLLNFSFPSSTSMQISLGKLAGGLYLVKVFSGSSFECKTIFKN